MKLPDSIKLNKTCSTLALFAAAAIYEIHEQYEHLYQAKPFFLSESCIYLPYSLLSDIFILIIKFVQKMISLT